MCGCDLRDKAADERDPRASAALDSDGRHYRREWRCPRAGGAVDPSALDDEHRAALERVGRLAGCDDPAELATCPGYYVRQPQAHRVVKALRWMRAGQLALVDPHPSAALVEALDLAQTSLAERERDELERIRKEQPKTDGR